MNLVKVDKAFLSIIRLFLSVYDKYKKYKFYILKFLDSLPDLWNSALAKNEKEIHNYSGFKAL